MGTEPRRQDRRNSDPNGLDEVDRQILRQLQDDARMSVRALAREVGMSPGAVGERLERMQARGVIRGFRLELDPVALGRGLEALIGMQLKQTRPLDQTVADLLAVPAVASVYLVTGQWDLLVLLRVGDRDDLRETLLGEVWAIPDFVRAETMVILDAHHDPAGWLP